MLLRLFVTQPRVSPLAPNKRGVSRLLSGGRQSLEDTLLTKAGRVGHLRNLRLLSPSPAFFISSPSQCFSTPNLVALNQLTSQVYAACEMGSSSTRPLLFNQFSILKSVVTAFSHLYQSAS